MESIVVYPASAEQFKMVKAVLKALKVQFELQPMILPSYVLKSVKESLRQHEVSEVISAQGFMDKHFVKNEVGE